MACEARETWEEIKELVETARREADVKNQLKYARFIFNLIHIYGLEDFFAEYSE
jgi:hypothetical protein